MPAVEFGISKWGGFRYFRGAVVAGWFSLAWFRQGILERLQLAERQNHAHELRRIQQMREAQNEIRSTLTEMHRSNRQ